MLAIVGETRSICWQLLNLTLVAKVCSNLAPPSSNPSYTYVRPAVHVVRLTQRPFDRFFQFGEALSEAPVFVWADRGKENAVATRRHLFYDHIDSEDGSNDKHVGFSYFSLPLRFSATERAQAHPEGVDRMTLETPVACRLILLIALLLQYLLMVILIFSPSGEGMVAWFSITTIIAAIRRGLQTDRVRMRM